MVGLAAYELIRSLITALVGAHRLVVLAGLLKKMYVALNARNIRVEPKASVAEVWTTKTEFAG